MAHFAKLGINSKVIGVEVVADDDTKNADGVEDESVGVQFLERIHGWPLWKQTSYNTRGGKHYKQDGTLSEDQSKALRKNYAGIGYTYNEDIDGFVTDKPHASWSLNSETGIWDPPVAYPTVTEYGDPAKRYDISWDEGNTRWVCVDEEETPNNFRWDASAKAWVAL